MAAPQITGPDSVARTALKFSTTLGSKFFSGTTDSSTVDMEVSIRGGAYTSDPDLIYFSGSTWTLPNPSAYPDGLPLVSGSNSLLVRSISSTGEVSQPVDVEVTLIQEADVGIVAVAPTNVSVESFDTKVRIKVEGLSDEDIVGYNFYCSTDAGGGSSGYQLISLEPVDSGTTTEDVSELGVITADNSVKLNAAGDPASDPLYVRVVGTQEDKDSVLLQSDFDDTIEVPETTTKVRVTTTVSGVRQITSFSFDHSRTAKTTSTPSTVYVGDFAATPDETPLYYVVTAVYYDSTTQKEIESGFSPEVAARPIRVSNILGTFPTRTRQQLARTFIASVYRSNPQLRVDPGSALRDVVIDPAMAEAERLRFVMDFLHRASNFSSLLYIDDPNGSGTSIEVTQSTYKLALKTAFFLTRTSDVQTLIDRAFESCAARFGKTRKSGSYARGEVTFYVKTKPTRTLTVALGSKVSAGSVTFATTRAASISLSNLASFYNPSTGRWSVTVPIKATTVGTSGNVGDGQIRTIASQGAKSLGFSVTNMASCFGGESTESNKKLAERSQNALASVDSGTERGVLQIAADVPGVLQVEVVTAGEDLMQRDYDGTAHRGGKVDVWILGENAATITDTFAFTFEIKQNVQFELIGDPADLTFRAVDSNLSSENPIVEMLDDADASYELKNATTGQVFLLTGVTVSSFDTITLDTSLDQPSVSLTDVILGDYRYRTGSKFEFPRQPVRVVDSVTGAVSGELASAGYDLYHPNAPLGLGRSTKAGDYLLVVGTKDADGVLTPSGNSIVVPDEPHTMVGAYPEYLDNLGCDSRTIVVKSSDGLTTYRGPNDSSGVSDYTILEGGQTTAVSIKRITTGNIASGGAVLISYKHDENFTVKYTVNQVVSVTQADLDAKKHLTGDLLVKEAVKVPVDLTATVVLKKGGDQSTADQSIRTNLENLFAGLRLGDPLRQSDVTSALDRSSQVSYVVEPLTLMVRQAGSQVVREALATDQSGDVTYIAAWSTAEISVWLIEEELDSATVTGGGSSTEYRGVFQDDDTLDLQIVPPQTALGLKAGRAYIIGSDGHNIMGLTDSATLTAAGYVTDEDQATRLKALTANRVLMSLAASDSPTEHKYTATYIVGADTGAKNIDPSKAEHLSIGNLTFTYDEDSA